MTSGIVLTSSESSVLTNAEAVSESFCLPARSTASFSAHSPSFASLGMSSPACCFPAFPEKVSGIDESGQIRGMMRARMKVTA